MGEFDILFDDEAWGDKPAPPTRTAVDAGPDARRASAGMAPRPGTTDPDPSGALYGDPSRPWDKRGYPIPVGGRDPMEADPIAQGVAAGMVTGPLGRAVTPLVTRTVGMAGPVVAPLAVGAAEGAGGAALTGNPIKLGAALGALGNVPTALRGIGEAVRTTEGRVAGGTMRDLGKHGSDAEKDALVRLGAEKVHQTAKEFGVTGAADAAEAAANVKAGLANIGGQIGQAWETVGASHARPLGSLMQTADRAQRALRGTRAGNEIADAIHEEMQALWDTHGGKADAAIPLGVLRKELTQSQDVGFSGAKYGKLPKAGQAIVAREVADILRTELDSGLSSVAADPALAHVAVQIDKLNPTYRALKTLDDVTSRMASKAPFREEPTLRQKIDPRVSAGAKPIEPPSGRSLGPYPRAVEGRAPGVPQTPGGTQLSAAQTGIATALSKKDEDGLRTLLAGELFGR